MAPTRSTAGVWKTPSALLVTRAGLRHGSTESFTMMSGLPALRYDSYTLSGMWNSLFMRVTTGSLTR